VGFRSFRRLTAGEITIARAVYGDSINYEAVRLYDRDYLSPLGFSTGTTTAPNGFIYFNQASLELFDALGGPAIGGDFSTLSVRAQSLLIHELGHVLQQQAGDSLILDALGGQEYNYRTPGLAFLDQNFEGRAEFFADLHLYRNGSVIERLTVLDGFNTSGFNSFVIDNLAGIAASTGLPIKNITDINQLTTTQYQAVKAYFETNIASNPAYAEYSEYVRPMRPLTASQFEQIATEVAALPVVDRSNLTIYDIPYDQVSVVI